MAEIDQNYEDEVPCARHPKLMTALTCSSCGTPICPECSIPAAVGIKCPDCGRLPRSARALVPRAALFRAIVVAIIAAIVGGFVFAVVNAAIGFLTIIIGLLVGMGIGEAIVRASGGYRDPVIVRIAAASASAGILFPLLLDIIDNPKVASSPGVIWTVIAAAAAAYGAGSRAGS